MLKTDVIETVIIITDKYWQKNPEDFK